MWQLTSAQKPRFLCLISWALPCLLAAALLSPAARAAEVPVLTLQRAVETALANHPSIRQGRGVVEQGQAGVAQETSAYWPTLSGQLSYDRVKRGFVAGVRGGASVDQFNQYDLGLHGEQTIYDFGRTSNRVAAARGALEADRFGLLSTQSDVVLNAKAAYFQVLQAKRLLDVAQVSIGRLEQHLEQAGALYKAGLRPKIDVTRAQVDLANGLADQVRQQGNVRVSKATLVNAMGVTQPLAFEVADVPVGELPAEVGPLVTEAVRRRPEVMQLQASIKGLEAQVGAARADYLPKLTGTADYNYTGSSFPLAENWDIGVSISIPLFNGFRTGADVAAAKGALHQQQAALDGLRQNVRLEVERDYSNVKTASEQLEAQRTAVTSAQENLDLAQARYRQGLGSAVEFTDAEVALTSAQANEVQALYNLLIAQAQLERAVAGPAATPRA